MKKTGLLILIVFISQTTFAYFPKQMTADSTQSSSPVVQPVVPSSDKLVNKEYKDLTQTHLSFTQKLGVKLLKHWLTKQNIKPKKSHWIKGRPDWVASVGGFLMGLSLGPIGFGISRLTNNEPLRKSASLGFTIFLYAVATYLALVLLVFLLLTIAVPK